MFVIEVTNNRASTKSSELLTKGQIGAQVQFMFNDHWSDMKKTAVFNRCGKTIDVVDSEWNGDIVTVPSEMTEKAGRQVYVGVYGVSEDGKRITPTLYAPLGVVALGAEPDGDPSTDPTLPVWAQIQGDIDNIKDELEDVSAKVVQSDWNQNDSNQPDYVKNRTHSSNPKYVFQGTSYPVWADITRYARVLIPKVVVKGVEYFNVKATHYYPGSTDIIADYELAPDVVVTINAKQQTITPPMAMFTYDSGDVPLPKKYIPQTVDWSAGDSDSGEYINNRYGGFIQPSDAVVGFIDPSVVDSGTNKLSSSAIVVHWKDNAPNKSEPIRIAGVYMDGTPFDNCCLYGAMFVNADAAQYGKNPFRFTTDGHSITHEVVEYATIFRAFLVKHPEWTLPLFTDASDPVWALAKRPNALVSTVSEEFPFWTAIGMTENGDMLSQKQIRVIADLTNYHELMISKDSIFYVLKSSIIDTWISEHDKYILPAPPYKIVTTEQPGSQGMYFSYIIENAAGAIFRISIGVYDGAVQSYTRINIPACAVEVSYNPDSDTFTANLTADELADLAARSATPIYISCPDTLISAAAFAGPLPLTFWTCLTSVDGKKLICKIYIYDPSNHTSLSWRLLTKTELPVFISPQGNA